MGASAFQPLSALECYVLRLNPFHLSTETRLDSLLSNLHIWDYGLHTNGKIDPKCALRVTSRASQEACADMLGWNVWCRLQDAQVRSEAQQLSASMKIIKTEVTPFGSAEASGSDFCWGAARVRSSMSRLITFLSEVWWAKRSGLLRLKAGFPMPSVASLSSLTRAKQGGQKIILKQNIFQWQAENSFQ